MHVTLTKAMGFLEVLQAKDLRTNKLLEVYKEGKEGCLGGSVVGHLPSAQGVIPECQDQDPHQDPAGSLFLLLPMSLPLSVSLMNKYIKSFKKKKKPKKVKKLWYQQMNISSITMYLHRQQSFLRFLLQLKSLHLMQSKEQLKRVNLFPRAWETYPSSAAFLSLQPYLSHLIKKSKYCVFLMF